MLSTEGDGLVLLPNNGKGWILGNLKGEELPGAVYDDVRYETYFPQLGELSAELVAVQKNGKWGAVDHQGRLVLPCQYDSPPLFYEGVAQICDQSLEQAIFIDREGNRLFEDSGHLAGCQLPYSDHSYAFYKGSCIVMDEEGRLGVINSRGELTVDFRYAYIEMLADGNLLVKEDYFPGQPNNLLRCGVISPQGDVLIPLEYQEIRPLNANDASSQDGDLFLVKQLKNPPSDPQTDVPWDAPANWYVYRIGQGKISPASDVEYDVHMVDGQYRYIQTQSDGSCYILDEHFEKLAGPFGGAFFTAVDDGYDRRYVVSSRDGKVGLLDIDGNTILPMEYDDLSWPMDGVLKAAKNGKYGIIRDTGEVLVDYAYEDICCILLQPYGLKVFCVYESKENETGTWNKCWLMDENGRRLSGANGGLYGWGGSAYNVCDYVISVMPFRGPNTKSGATPVARMLSLHTRAAVTPMEDGADNEQASEFYGVERITDYQLEDSSTGIRVVAPPDSIGEGTALAVEPLVAGAEYDAVKAELAGTAEAFSLFDISLTKGGAAVQPAQAVQVAVPLPDGYSLQTTRIYAVEQDGQLTPLSAVEQGGYAVFSTSRMGKFVVASLKQPAQTSGSTHAGTSSTEGENGNPSTGYEPSYGWLLTVSVLLLSGTLAWHCRAKRRIR